jgi:acetyl esterase/lipase
MLYIHGGGYISGIPEMFTEAIKRFIEKRPCVVLAPDYRKAYTAPFPAGFNDCYETLLWARDNADRLRIRGENFIVAGHSAGGGLTAAVTLKARDTGEADIAFQMPIYPMIDDRQPSDPGRYIQSPVWDTENNRIGWTAYLAGLKKQRQDIPAYAAPARSTDYRNLPPTITFVGTLEPFMQETRDYVEGLRSAGIEVAFKLFEGCFHGFEGLVPKAAVSQEANQFSLESYADFYDKYIE